MLSELPGANRRAGASGGTRHRGEAVSTDKAASRGAAASTERAASRGSGALAQTDGD